MIDIVHHSNVHWPANDGVLRCHLKLRLNRTNFSALFWEVYRRINFKVRSLRGQIRRRSAHLRSSLDIGRRNGVLFIGYAEGNLGLGQAFRNTLRAAQTSGLPFGVYPFRAGIETRLLEPLCRTVTMKITPMT